MYKALSGALSGALSSVSAVPVQVYVGLLLFLLFLALFPARKEGITCTGPRSKVLNGKCVCPNVGTDVFIDGACVDKKKPCRNNTGVIVPTGKDPPYRCDVCKKGSAPKNGKCEPLNTGMFEAKQNPKPADPKAAQKPNDTKAGQVAPKPKGPTEAECKETGRSLVGGKCICIDGKVYVNGKCMGKKQPCDLGKGKSGRIVKASGGEFPYKCEACPAGQVPDNGNCVAGCPNGWNRGNDGNCVDPKAAKISDKTDKYIDCFTRGKGKYFDPNRGENGKCMRPEVCTEAGGTVVQGRCLNVGDSAAGKKKCADSGQWYDPAKQGCSDECNGRISGGDCITGEEDAVKAARDNLVAGAKCTTDDSKPGRIRKDTKACVQYCGLTNYVNGTGDCVPIPAGCKRNDPNFDVRTGVCKAAPPPPPKGKECAAGQTWTGTECLTKCAPPTVWVPAESRCMNKGDVCMNQGKRGTVQLNTTKDGYGCKPNPNPQPGPGKPNQGPGQVKPNVPPGQEGPGKAPGGQQVVKPAFHDRYPPPVTTEKQCTDQIPKTNHVFVWRPYEKVCVEAQIGGPCGIAPTLKNPQTGYEQSDNGKCEKIVAAPAGTCKGLRQGNACIAEGSSCTQGGKGGQVMKSRDKPGEYVCSTNIGTRCVYQNNLKTANVEEGDLCDFYTYKSKGNTCTKSLGRVSADKFCRTDYTPSGRTTVSKTCKDKCGTGEKPDPHCATMPDGSQRYFYSKCRADCEIRETNLKVHKLTAGTCNGASGRPGYIPGYKEPNKLTAAGCAADEVKYEGTCKKKKDVLNTNCRRADGSGGTVQLNPMATGFAHCQPMRAGQAACEATFDGQKMGKWDPVARKCSCNKITVGGKPVQLVESNGVCDNPGNRSAAGCAADEVKYEGTCKKKKDVLNQDCRRADGSGGTVQLNPMATGFAYCQPTRGPGGGSGTANGGGETTWGKDVSDCLRACPANGTKVCLVSPDNLVKQKATSVCHAKCQKKRSEWKNYIITALTNNTCGTEGIDEDRGKRVASKPTAVSSGVKRAPEKMQQSACEKSDGTYNNGKCDCSGKPGRALRSRPTRDGYVDSCQTIQTGNSERAKKQCTNNNQLKSTDNNAGLNDKCTLHTWDGRNCNWSSGLVNNNLLCVAPGTNGTSTGAGNKPGSSGGNRPGTQSKPCFVDSTGQCIEVGKTCRAKGNSIGTVVEYEQGKLGCQVKCSGGEKVVEGKCIPSGSSRGRLYFKGGRTQDFGADNGTWFDPSKTESIWYPDGYTMCMADNRDIFTSVRNGPALISTPVQGSGSLRIYLRNSLRKNGCEQETVEL